MTLYEKLLREVNSKQYPITKVIMSLCPRAVMRPVQGNDRRWTMDNPFGGVGAGGANLTCIIDLDRNSAFVPELGLGGSTVNFIMDLKGVSEREAVNLAIDIINAPEKGKKSEDQTLAIDPNDLAEEEDEKDEDQEPLRREKVRGMLRWLHAILQRELWSDKDNDGRKFCERRQWSDEMLKIAQIGYAAEGAILQAAYDDDIDMQFLVDHGVMYEHTGRDGVTSYTCAYDHRIAYPVYNQYNELTAFSFRDDGYNQAQWDIAHEKRMKMLRDKGDITTYNMEKSQHYAKKCLYMRNEASLEPSRLQLFGIESAMPAMLHTHDRKMYLVEGQPDQMRIRSLGVENVVAIMTSSLTEEQTDLNTGAVEEWSKGKISILKAIGTHTVCIVPDTDTYDPDRGEHYGVGIRQTIENVEKLVRSGLKVYVKEITLRDKTMTDDETGEETFIMAHTQKADPDSYFGEFPSVWQQLEETPWHLWLARKWSKDMSVNDVEIRAIYIKRMAQILSIFTKEERAALQAEVLRENRYMQKALLANCVSEAVGEQIQRKQQREQKSQGDLARFGFVEQNGCYKGISKEEYFTDFIINPRYFIKKVGGGSFWICQLTCFDGKTEVVNPTDEDVTSLAKFKKLAASAAMSFDGKEMELSKIFKYIKSTAEEVKKIGRYGWQTALKCYAWGNGAMINGQWYPANKYGVVDLPGDTHLFIPSAQTYDQMNEDDDEEKYQFAHSFSYAPPAKADKFSSGVQKRYSIKDVFAQMHDVIGEAGDFGACFLVASIFFDVVRKSGRGFPIFTCYGPKGSGKSTIGEVLTHFFGTKHMMQNLESATPAALDSLVTSASNCVVHWDEYSEGVGRDTKKLDQIKNLWGGDGRSKMSASTNFQEASSKKVKCGVVLTGEVMPNHIDSMPRRMVMFNFFDDKEKFAKNEQAYNRLVEMYTPGLQYLTAEILAQRSLFEQEYPTVYQSMLKLVNEHLKDQHGIESSIKTNWTQLLATYMTLQSFDWWPFNITELLPKTVEKIIWQSGVSESKNRRVVFWRQVILAAEQDLLWQRVHLQIKPANRLSSSEPLAKEWAKRCNRVLLLRFDNVYQIIEKQCQGNQALRDQLMSAGSMRDYINKECYLGDTRWETFYDADQRGYVLPDRTGKFQAKRKSGVMVFDYDKLKQRYDIDIESVPECKFAGQTPTDFDLDNDSNEMSNS